MTEEKHSKSESKEQQPKKEWKLDQGQYNRLIECSKKGPEGIKEWNKWRKENSDEQIWLQGADLQDANLQGVKLDRANLQGADLANADLQGAKLYYADLQGTDLWLADLQGAKLEYVNLQRAKLRAADLQGAKLLGANLQGAELWSANLQEAGLATANLQGANLRNAKLQGTYLWAANLQRAKFWGAILNGSTCFLECEIDKDTDFRHTALENARIKSGTKILLKYNIRRMNWKDWYWGSSNHKVYDKDDARPKRRACRVLWRLLITWPVRLFWKMSNYGRSTGRIMLTFFALAIAFTFIYFLQPCYIMVNRQVGDIRGFVHALYFSVVTMTTLGFGDIAANPDSWPGQLILMVQVIFGYVLLGALVTRLAVLFTADGPAGSFTPMDKKTKELLVKLKKDKDKELKELFAKLKEDMEKAK